MMPPILRIHNLTVALPPDQANRPLISEVDIKVEQGEIIGLVGESGSGKSTTAKAAIGVFPTDSIVTGRIEVDGDDLMTMSSNELRGVRSERVAMVFQDPRASFNPLRRVGEYVTEPLVYNRGWRKEDAMSQAEKLLVAAELDKPSQRLSQYPHELSGGMLQRVAIAGALVGDPDLLLADEPTSSLDVTTQAEILATLKHLQRKRDLGLLFITHNLHLAAAFCHRVYVMYAGRIMEVQPASTLFVSPKHPYTAGLLQSSPGIDSCDEIQPIPGKPPSLYKPPKGCAFADRCEFVKDACRDRTPSLHMVKGVLTACVRCEDILDRLLTTGMHSMTENKDKNL